jgi:hypothetical protein
MEEALENAPGADTDADPAAGHSAGTTGEPLSRHHLRELDRAVLEAPVELCWALQLTDRELRTAATGRRRDRAAADQRHPRATETVRWARAAHLRALEAHATIRACLDGFTLLDEAGERPPLQSQDGADETYPTEAVESWITFVEQAWTHGDRPEIGERPLGLADVVELLDRTLTVCRTARSARVLDALDIEPEMQQLVDTLTTHRESLGRTGSDSGSSAGTCLASLVHEISHAVHRLADVASDEMRIVTPFLVDQIAVLGLLLTVGTAAHTLARRAQAVLEERPRGQLGSPAGVDVSRLSQCLTSLRREQRRGRERYEAHVRERNVAAFSALQPGSSLELAVVTRLDPPSVILGSECRRWADDVDESGLVTMTRTARHSPLTRGKQTLIVAGVSSHNYLLVRERLRQLSALDVLFKRADGVIVSTGALEHLQSTGRIRTTARATRPVVNGIKDIGNIGGIASHSHMH